MALEAVLIDLDGTLWDSAPWYAKLLAADDAAQRRELAVALRDAAGGPRAAELLKARYTSTAFAKAAATYAGRLVIYPGAAAALGALRQDLTLGVVTSLPSWMARPMLGAVGMTAHFRVVQTAAWRVPAKPHPASLKLALGAIGVSAGDALYIGDSETDAQAAAHAGMAFLGAAWGYGRLHGPDSVAGWSAVRGAL